MTRRFDVGGRVVEESARHVRVVTSAPGRHVVVVGSHLAALRTARSPDGSVFVWWRGRTRQVRPVRDDVARDAEARGHAGVPGAVTSPLPAVVVRVLVAVGDRVTRGQPVVVVSAMKMETTLVAPRDGVVCEVRTVAGCRVRPGDALVIVSDGTGGDGDGNG